MKGLSAAGTWERSPDGSFHGAMAEDWCQGRTVFGGLLVTAAVRAMQGRGPAGRSLRSIVAAFVAPVTTDEARIEVLELRSGSALTFLEGRVSQAGQTCTTVTAGFGAGRDAGLRVQAPARPVAPAPDEVPALPFLPGVTPAFTQHFDYRWTAPVAPYGGAEVAHVQGWIRPRDDGPVDSAGILALIDAWAPPIITRMPRPLPVSSITWQVNLLRPLPAGGIPADAWWFFESRARAAGLGYSDGDGWLWAPDGQPAATSRQLVADFPAPSR